LPPVAYLALVPEPARHHKYRPTTWAGMLICTVIREGNAANMELPLSELG
jgi:hypothetical protein